MKQFSWGAVFRGAIFLGGLFPGGTFPGGIFPGGFFPGGIFPDTNKSILYKNTFRKSIEVFSVK